jgi:type 1 glutamine amidotransferase
MESLKILFLQGSRAGHRLEQVVHELSSALTGLDAGTETVTSLKRPAAGGWLGNFHAISPCWTMGALSTAESAGLHRAMRSGRGLPGIQGAILWSARRRSGQTGTAP